MVTNRAVSEMLSYVFVFSLIITTVGLVYTGGYARLEHVRDTEQLENTERAFDILANNIESIHSGDAPRRTTEFKLHQAKLFLGSSASFRVTIENVATPDPSYKVTTYPIVYQPLDSETRLLYLNGAVFQETSGGTLLLNPPAFAFRKDGATRTAVIPIIETRSPESEAITGTSTVLVRAKLAVAEVMTRRTAPTTANTDPDGDGVNEYLLTFSSTTSVAQAPRWEASIEQRLEAAYPTVSNPCVISGATVECTFPVERLHVTATRIPVSIQA